MTSLDLRSVDERFPVLKFFSYDHLPLHLQQASKPFRDLAYSMAERVVQHPAETAAGLRKLLEAKDCFVRAGI